jgi:hypothetical protein
MGEKETKTIKHGLWHTLKPVPKTRQRAPIHIIWQAIAADEGRDCNLGASGGKRDAGVLRCGNGRGERN